MAKKDLPKELQPLYFPSAKEPVFVNVPAMQFAMVDGVGSPEAKDFSEAIGVLYGVAYTVKFAAKAEGIRDIRVMPLEFLMWGEGKEDFRAVDREHWRWTMMLMEPPAVSRKLFDESVRQLRNRKNPPGLDKVRLETFREGKAAQILHIGPYSAETPTIERLHAFIRENGYRLSGKHHEIYMTNPQRSAPEKLKTVIRQPASRGTGPD